MKENIVINNDLGEIASCFSKVLLSPECMFCSLLTIRENVDFSMSDGWNEFLQFLWRISLRMLRFTEKFLSMLTFLQAPPT